MLLRCVLIIILGFLTLTTSLFSEASTYTKNDILELVKKYIPNAPVILEAGAHKGEDTVVMGKTWPQGIIHAFEPLPKTYQILKNTTQDFANVKGYPYALSDKIGKANFYVCVTGEGASSLLAPKPILDPYMIFDLMPVVVDCTILDEWAKQNKVAHIDFMWLDMEGAELIVLKSSCEILSTVKAIYTEVNFQ